jgi:hypothetical protein
LLRHAGVPELHTGEHHPASPAPQVDPPEHAVPTAVPFTHRRSPNVHVVPEAAHVPDVVPAHCVLLVPHSPDWPQFAGTQQAAPRTLQGPPSKQSGCVTVPQIAPSVQVPAEQVSVQGVGVRVGVGLSVGVQELCAAPQKPTVVGVGVGVTVGVTVGVFVGPPGPSCTRYSGTPLRAGKILWLSRKNNDPVLLSYFSMFW